MLRVPNARGDLPNYVEVTYQLCKKQSALAPSDLPALPLPPPSPPGGLYPCICIAEALLYYMTLYVYN